MLLKVGADAAFRSSGFELRGEVVRAIQEITTEPDLQKTGGYVQIAYRATPILEPVVRFSVRDMSGENMYIT